MEAVNSVVKDEEEFIDAFRDNVIRILGSYSDNVEPTEYDEKIDSLQKQMLALTRTVLKRKALMRSLIGRTVRLQTRSGSARKKDGVTPGKAAGRSLRPESGRHGPIHSEDELPIAAV